jgi:hypothetical protein
MNTRSITFATNAVLLKSEEKKLRKYTETQVRKDKEQAG